MLNTYIQIKHKDKRSPINCFISHEMFHIQSFTKISLFSFLCFVYLKVSGLSMLLRSISSEDWLCYYSDSGFACNKNDAGDGDGDGDSEYDERVH